MAAPAGLAAGRAVLGSSAAQRLLRRLLLAGLLAGVAPVVVVLMAIVVLFDRAASAPPAGSPAGIPAVYLPIYRAAGDAYGVSWALLAAIHRRRSAFSTLRVAGASGDAVSSGWNGCGAAGPMQFGIVGVAPYARHRHRAARRADRDGRGRDVAALPRRVPAGRRGPPGRYPQMARRAPGLPRRRIARVRL